MQKAPYNLVPKNGQFEPYCYQVSYQKIAILILKSKKGKKEAKTGKSIKELTVKNQLCALNNFSEKESYDLDNIYLIIRLIYKTFIFLQ